MRILQIHNYYATRGGECGVVDAEKQLLESRGHEVLQYTRNSGALSDCSIIEKVYSYWNIPYNPHIERDLVNFIKGKKPDVAHVHNVFPLLSPAIYVALKKYGIPVIQTVHNFRFLCPNGTFFTDGRVCERCQEKGFIQAVRYRCMRNSLLTSAQYARAVKRLWKTGVLTKSVDRFITLNEFSAAKLASGGIPISKIDICGNFASKIQDSLQDKGSYFLFLGRLSPEKGVRTLITAARHVGGCQVKIAGSGPLEEEVRESVSTLQNVEFIGYVEGMEKEALIGGACAMIVPSEWYENFPISVVESMSLGTPVIASRIGGLPEMVEDGHSGMLFDAGNVSELSVCIEMFCTDMQLADTMGRNALQYAHGNFAPEQHAAKLEQIYATALENYNKGI